MKRNLTVPFFISVQPTPRLVALKFIPVGIANGQEAIEIGQHQVDQFGIKMSAFLFLDQRQNFIQRPGSFIATIRTQGVKDIDLGGDPPFERNSLARQPLRITGTIPLFVVV